MSWWGYILLSLGSAGILWVLAMVMKDSDGVLEKKKGD